MSRVVVILAGLICLLGWGCRSTRSLESPNAGRVPTYDPGSPAFDFETITSRTHQITWLIVHVNVPRRSLIFLRDDESFRAIYELSIRLRDRKEKTLYEEKVVRDTIRTTQYAQTITYRPVFRKDSLKIKPGHYLLELTVSDRQTGKQTERRQYITIGSDNEEKSDIGPIVLSGERPGEPLQPLVSLYVPEDVDSLKAGVEVSGTSDLEDLNVRMVLLKFKSDTSVAIPPFWMTPVFGSLFYKGIDYSKPDTIQVSRRAINNSESAASIQFLLPELTEGLYRIDISTLDSEENGKDETIRYRRRRDFLITSPGFPEVVSLDQMTEALVYLARKKELEILASANSPEDKKRKFDAFWGAVFPNRELAANVIRLYYSRVEEANLLFTNYKAGWKTDRGMLYVILGAPSYIERFPSRETWHYTYGDLHSAETFTFLRKKVVNSDPEFETFSLERNPNFESLWIRALSHWREGVVL